jgi:hypothetical protein
LEQIKEGAEDELELLAHTDLMPPDADTVPDGANVDTFDEELAALLDNEEREGDD